MLGPTRPVPRVGARALVKHFGGDSEQATVVAVHEEGRGVTVRTLTGALHDGGQAGGSDGELYEFTLSPANARFVFAGSAHGPRLELLGSS
jgi:hypothetical protein